MTDVDKNTQDQGLQRLIRLVFDEWTVLKNQQKTPLMYALQGYIEGNSQRCKSLETLVYLDNPTQVLLPLAITVSQQQLEDYDDLEQQARILNNLSVRFAEAGEHQQGLEASQRSVEIYEKLAEQNFATYALDLAMSLNNLSNRLAQAGERQRGMEAIQRAAEIYEQLAEQNFAAYMPDLANSLNNLSIDLAEAGDKTGAIKNMERAIELIEPFAKLGTLYAERHQTMLKGLANLKSP